MYTRPITHHDFADVLALNDESVHYLSPLSPAGLESLCKQSPLHLVIESDGEVLGFIITLAQGADYDSVNYQWFARRYEQFLYVDRIVVSNGAQATGAGSAMYREVFAFAHDQGFAVIACEFDVDPPNPGSARFHSRFGFREVAQQLVANGKKAVSLQVASPPYPAALAHHRCPLCGGPNSCAAAAAGTTEVACWCSEEQFSDELLAFVSTKLKRVACICRSCAEAASR
jgi:predicted GNAT superfamily acetyltransferase